VLFDHRAVCSRRPLCFALRQFSPFRDTGVFPRMLQIINKQLARGDYSRSHILALVLLFQLLGLPQCFPDHFPAELGTESSPSPWVKHPSVYPPSGFLPTKFCPWGQRWESTWELHCLPNTAAVQRHSKTEAFCLSFCCSVSEPKLVQGRACLPPLHWGGWVTAMNIPLR